MPVIQVKGIEGRGYSLSRYGPFEKMEFIHNINEYIGFIVSRACKLQANIG